MSQPLVEVRGLSVDYFSDKGPYRRVLEDVTFNIDPGETVGLLGESGCGKTTLALSMLRLLSHKARVTCGSIRILGHDMLTTDKRQIQKLRGAEVSIIFQEPEMALNPVMDVGDQICEVLRAHTDWNHRRRRKEAESILNQVRLSRPHVHSAYPHELSGGERQRVVIAQALVCKPAFLIADEPTSALDNAIQAEIISVLKQMKERLHLTLLFITHNPLLLAGFADRVLVMYAGRIIEEGTVVQVLRQPRHPHTQALLRSIPPTPEKHVYPCESLDRAHTRT
jgi:peptide/nickel transport system ATP-binding protein